MLTWGELKNRTYEMMDLEESEFEEYNNAIIAGANDAINDLSPIFAPKKTYQLSQEAQDEDGANVYDMYQLTEDNGTRTFLGFCAVPTVMKMGEDGLEAVPGWQVIADQYLYLPKTFGGEYIVNYKSFLPEITEETPDSFVIGFDPQVAALIPLFASWRAYINDDKAIATMYFNEYSARKAELLAKTTYAQSIKVEFIDGGIF